MKYKAIYWILAKPFVKRYLKRHFDRKSIKTIFKNAKAEYKSLLGKSDDIGSDNPMASNLYFALVIVSFLTANRDIVTEKMLSEMIESTFNSSFLKKLMPLDLNREKDILFMKHRMLRASKWADKHKNEHPGTWEFNFDDKHKDGYYFYFTKCPIAKFFKDNNMENLTAIFCGIDHLTIKLAKGKLIRNCTLANGDAMCDFWIVGDKVENPR
ncbi:MAG: L-2-amino-thiazoline-4-carboxylic acid hydrolase [Eubacteriaceae bacterium]|jgi:hypothetical protein|nr:L-2-amino-thiazoline-4-carboxylic acid hydrolase [Eubacteriaceae bacterium]